MGHLNKLNGGLAIYYGIGCVIASVGGIVGLGIWIYRAFTTPSNISWGILVFLIVMTVVFGLAGYSLLRVGNEELEE